MHRVSVGVTRIIAIVATFLIVGIAAAWAQHNTITFDNKSGEPALVRLIGPTQTKVTVPTGGSRTVNAAVGQYHIKVRYGVAGSYRYTKGEEFEVAETMTTRSATTITLHKVIGGDYDTHPISEHEFNRDRAPATVAAPRDLSSGSSDTSGAKPKEEPSTSWQSDWSTFVKDLSKIASRQGSFIYAVDATFAGKHVEWTGTIKEIERP